MSHHFDTVLAKEDPRLNVADMYLFDGENDSTVFVLTANVDAGISAPDTLHEEGIYSFRIQQDDSGNDDIAFKFRFGAPHHADNQEHQHTQPYRVIFSKENEMDELEGDTILEGESGTAAEKNGVKAFVGLVPELWAANAVAFGAFMNSIWELNRFDMSVWEDAKNFFERRNVYAIVLQVPNTMLGKGIIKVWSNITLFGHAAEVQVARWGVPLFSHLFLHNPVDDQVEAYHRHSPTEDLELFGPTIERFVTRVTTLAGSAKDPNQYAKSVVARICPSLLPYEVGSKASFTLNRFNGRPLYDDALDVMFSLAANLAISDGAFPDETRIETQFPYYGRPYSKEEQADLQPIPQHVHKTY